ncbi:uncharacterized protein LOC117333740 [Pecten maximus]|uniref:uncharacterized protein LOC117333740 n=1 Tax=Pecten maximus TaxID=6579 RepID=UPI00145912F1|nr:uncharacterized protein LOC117333740 [Pecten maximus]
MYSEGIMTTMNPIVLIFVYITASLGHTLHLHKAVTSGHITSTDENSTPNPDILCPYILSLNCQTQVNEHYEVCGSDGVTYTNNCHFLQTSCVTTTLELARQGACHFFTTADVADVVNSIPDSISTTKGTTAKTLTVGTSTALSSAVHSDMTTTTDTTMTSMATNVGKTTETIKIPTTEPFITTRPSVTIMSNVQIIKSVFCDNKDNITCDRFLHFQCGSNGQVYPNQCEFYKATCGDANLVVVDPSRCVP